MHMNAYIERFNKHQLQGALVALQEAMERVKLTVQSSDAESSSSEPSDIQRAAFVRLFRVATFLTKAVSQIDAFVWTPNALGSANAAISALTSAIEQFEANGTTAHYESAGDAALDQFRKASISRITSSSKDAEASFVRFCERAEAAIGSIEDLKVAIGEKEKEIANDRDMFHAQIVDLGSQLEAFKAQFEAQKARVDELVTSQSQAFQNSQSERTATFSQEATNRSAAFQQWRAEAEENIEKVLSGAQNAAAKTLEKMTEHLERASEILGIVAASGVSGHYKETAERDFRSANIYRRWAFVFFVIMAGVITYVVTTIRSEGFRWEMGLFRVGVGMALLIPAYYCAKESTKHREAEKRNRRLQIELATLEPYLEKIGDPMEMKAIIKEKANSYFMGQVPREPDDDVESRITGKEWKRREEQFMEMVKTLGASLKR